MTLSHQLEALVGEEIKWHRAERRDCIEWAQNEEAERSSFEAIASVHDKAADRLERILREAEGSGGQARALRERLRGASTSLPYDDELGKWTTEQIKRAVRNARRIIDGSDCAGLHTPASLSADEEQSK